MSETAPAVPAPAAGQDIVPRRERLPAVELTLPKAEEVKPKKITVDVA